MRLAILIVLPTCLLTSGWSQVSDLTDCRTIADPLERVACYDAALDAASQESVELTVSPNAESIFGRSDESIKDTLKIEDVREIAYPVIEVRQSPLGHLIVVLENGQIWSQTDATRLNLKPGDKVSVRAGFGGSYYLQKASGSRSVKVRRTD